MPDHLSALIALAQLGAEGQYEAAARLARALQRQAARNPDMAQGELVREPDSNGSVRESAEVPTVLQSTRYTCGPACMAAVLTGHGLPASEELLARLLGTHPERGTHPDALRGACEALGLPHEEGHGLSLDELAQATEAGVPVIAVIQRHGGGHYVVVKSVESDGVHVLDPSPSEGGKEVIISADKWEAGWHDRSADGQRFERWGLAVGPPEVQESLREEAERQVGDVWQGPSGHWFTKHPDGRVVPAKAPGGGQPAPGKDSLVRQGAAPGSKKVFGPSKAKAVPVSSEPDPDRLKKTAAKLLGKKVPFEHIASLVGAPDDATVLVSMGEDGKSLKVGIIGDNFSAVRRIHKNGAGEVYVYNEIIRVSDRTQGQGTGSDIFGRQVEQCAAAGVAFIRCHAARKDAGGGKAFNGYYTWPRLGYDMDLDDLEDQGGGDLRREIEKRWPDAYYISDVMATPEGREWWKQNGTDLEKATFSLAKGSRSLKIFEAYMEERAARPKSTTESLAESVFGPQGGGEEITLTPEEEAALERAWERVGPELKAAGVQLPG